MEESGKFDRTSALWLSAGALCLAATVVGVYKTTPESKTISVNCGADQTAGAIFNLNDPELPNDFKLYVDDGKDSKAVFVKNTGRLMVTGADVLSTDAGKTLVKFDDGTRLIAGAPIPQTLDGYYAGDEALTLICKEATPESVARSQAQIPAITS